MVQNLVKTWEMEMFNKARPEDFKTVNTEKYTFSLNGRKPLPLMEKLKAGGYNSFLQTSLPEEFQCFKPSQETTESAHQAFLRTFPRGFALEIVEVYSGPPTIVYKFRHWGYMEGPFLGHAPTGEKVEYFGIAIFGVDEEMKVEKVEFFFDRGELLGGLVKGPPLDKEGSTATPSICPFAGTG
ncbi:pathogen-related protein isoform X2 [Amborella trichopoda]|nr:pathogen-related protein isoform X2 [Amborella trichopoda]|eukprot:XP_020531687.1 pathogen-related protein isoform X2 [Amborella trichopoda]